MRPFQRFDVVCKNNTWVDSQLTKGNTYTVVRVEHGELEEYWHVKDDRGVVTAFYKTRFRMVKKKQSPTK